MSELHELLDRRLQSDERDSTQHRVTVRLGSDLHRKLVRLASAFNMSKTAACEDVTAAAIKDAWSYYIESLDDHERDELFAEMEEDARRQDAEDVEQLFMGRVS